jgi:hypothetical protein
LYNNYKILGVSQSASLTEIKTAFRKKAKELHPDNSKSDTSARYFIILKNAYDILSNTERRKLHDLEIQMHGVRQKQESKTVQDNMSGNAFRKMKYYSTVLDDSVIYGHSPVLYNSLFLVGIFFGIGMIVCAAQVFWLEKWYGFFLPIFVIPGFIMIKEGVAGIKFKREPLIYRWYKFLFA